MDLIMNSFNCSWICCWNNANSNENRDNADGEELEPFQKKHDEEENEIPNVKKPVFKQPGPAVAAVVRSNENDENQIFLCCADQRIREDQIDFCPKFWFREFSNNKSSSSNNNSRKNNNNNNSKCSCRKRVQTVIWRICFLLTCLPMCYPCYLSRSIRRRKRQKIISSDMVSQERLGIQVISPVQKKLIHFHLTNILAWTQKFSRLFTTYDLTFFHEFFYYYRMT